MVVFIATRKVACLTVRRLATASIPQYQTMRNMLTAIIFGAAIAVHGALGQQSTTAPQPPIGVPSKAKLFNGKWYHIYLEKSDWKAEGLWSWSDGSEMRYKSPSFRPDNGVCNRNAATRGKENYLMISGPEASWNDEAEQTKLAGFICEWKAK